jgi:hypothetical protein
MSAYEHWIVEGPPERLRGFMDGWSAAAGLDPMQLGRAVRWAEEWDVDAASLRQRFAELLRPGAVTHLLVDVRYTEALRRALASHGDALHLRSAVAIASAQFEFAFDILARTEAADVRALFETPPAGVTITWREPPRESTDVDGHGMYAPGHAYRFHGRAVASGDVDAILSLHVRCRQHERIQQQPVHLATA